MKKNINIKNWIWIGLFILLIGIVPISFKVFGTFFDSTNSENRNLTERPVFEIQSVSEYPRQYEEYFNDNLPYRNQFIRFINGIDFWLLRSPSDQRVVIGDDGWLFFNGVLSERGSASRALGDWMFSEEDLAIIKNNMEVNERIFNSQGVEFAVFIAPNKEAVYIDKIPEKYRRISDYTAVDQLVDYLKENTDINVIYPKEEIMEFRKNNPDIITYRKLDTHWNNVGAYIGAKALADAIGEYLPPIDEVNIDGTVVDEGGDTSSIQNVIIKKGDMSYSITGFSDVETKCTESDFWHNLCYETEGSNGKTMVMRRDSFMTAMAPYISTCFKKGRYVHKDNFNGQYVFDEDADIYVVESVERHIPDFTWYAETFYFGSYEETDGRKIYSISPWLIGPRDTYIKIENYKDDGTTELLYDDIISDVEIMNVSSEETGVLKMAVYVPEYSDEIIQSEELYY